MRTGDPADGAGGARLAYLELHEVAQLLRTRTVSPVEVCDEVLHRIRSHDGELGAFITVTAEAARAAAAVAADEIAAGAYRGTLHGIPMSLKDVIATAGVRTTCGSRLYEGAVPDEDATAWARLARGGAVLVGKNNMMEFAYAAEIVNERWGVTRNPWDLDRTAHGSSSGSAVAVATGMAYAALASETGASIMRPASFCGVVGFKPSYGRVSRAGVAPTAWSMDHVGVLARSVRDAGIVYQEMAGTDVRDRTTRAAPPALSALVPEQPGALRDLTVGVPCRHIDGQVDDEVATAFYEAVDVCRAAGARVVEIDPPGLDYAAVTSVTIRTAEAWAHHAAAYRAQPDGFSAGLRRQLERGSELSAEDYLLAQRARQQIAASLRDVMRDVDVVASPTTPTAATPIRAGMAAVRDRPWDIGPSQYNLARVFSLLGLPTVSLPSGYTGAGLPLSLQLGGRRWEEATVLAAAHDYEASTGWLRHPPGFG